MSEVELVKEIRIEHYAGCACRQCRAADTIERLLKERDEQKRVTSGVLQREYETTKRYDDRLKAAEAQVAALREALAKIATFDFSTADKIGIARNALEDSR